MCILYMLVAHFVVPYLSDWRVRMLHKIDPCDSSRPNNLPFFELLSLGAQFISGANDNQISMWHGLAIEVLPYPDIYIYIYVISAAYRAYGEAADISSHWIG